MSHQLAVFAGHWCGASRDIKYLIFHLTSQNQMIEGSITLSVGTLHGMSPPCQVCWSSYCGHRSVFTLTHCQARQCDKKVR